MQSGKKGGVLGGGKDLKGFVFNAHGSGAM